MALLYPVLLTALVAWESQISHKSGRLVAFGNTELGGPTEKVTQGYSL